MSDLNDFCDVCGGRKHGAYVDRCPIFVKLQDAVLALIERVKKLEAKVESQI